MDDVGHAVKYVCTASTIVLFSVLFYTGINKVICIYQSLWNMSFDDLSRSSLD